MKIRMENRKYSWELGTGKENRKWQWEMRDIKDK